jgi:hypothetical protein
MNNKFMLLLAFSAGAAVGTAVSSRILRRKYESLVQEEIDSVRKAFSCSDEFEIMPTKQNADDSESEKNQYESIVKDYNGNKKDDEASYTHIITPEELGEIEEYDTTTLYYYADEVLVTLDDTVITDYEELVGLGFEEHFGEFEDDSVCVRNDKLKRDYEILRDSRRYSDIKKSARFSGVEE